jgi:hypothetical protein
VLEDVTFSWVFCGGSRDWSKGKQRIRVSGGIYQTCKSKEDLFHDIIDEIKEKMHLDICFSICIR